MNDQVHVAVGVICNKQGQYLVSKRHDHLHQGGLWEFPGGKVEAGESVFAALKRELYEELDIHIKQAEPLVKLAYQYPDKNVLLDVWLVDSFDGVAHSPQGQEIRWLALSELSHYDFPVANRGILNCLNYPVYYAITGQYTGLEDYTSKLHQCLTRQPVLLQCRLNPETENILDFIDVSLQLCKAKNTKLIVNSDITFLDKRDIDGIHLNSKRLFDYSSRPVDDNKILAASVHNKAELEQASRIKADLVVVSPVFHTTSHLCQTTLGWDGLTELVKHSDIPVFALGGMKKSMLAETKKTGAYGIAAIREFWDE